MSSHPITLQDDYDIKHALAPHPHEFYTEGKDEKLNSMFVWPYQRIRNMILLVTGPLEAPQRWSGHRVRCQRLRSG